jgi:lipopolysaccharide/colanic/teichoic acid biosynthesis glycosyltransferase
VNVYPIVVDSRPSYVQGGHDEVGSLLLLPVQDGTLLDHLRARFAEVTGNPILVVATFPLTERYVQAIQRAVPSVKGVLAPGQLEERLCDYEPSDSLYLVDPRCFPARGLDPGTLLRHSLSDPRWARHLVALDTSAGGTKERIDRDGEGRVRRIQRYYDAITWPFMAGVCCSVLPIASTLVPSDLNFLSLTDLRHALSVRGVPSRDYPLQDSALDLSQEAGLLAFSEGLIFAMASRNGTGATGPMLVGKGHEIHPSAKLIGPVVLHPGAAVEEDAKVVGPAILGANSRVRAGAVVAQSVVAAGLTVPSSWVLRHRVVMEPLPDGPPALRDPSPPIYRDPSTSMRPLREPAVVGGKGSLRFKRAFDVVSSSLALLVLAPLLAAVAVAVRLGSPGPILFGDKREGRNGLPFRCWKFRTMFADASARQRDLAQANQMDGPQFKVDRDPRVTPLGRWLRIANLDELPQLFNVVLGQMSLVGPRPSPFRENQLCIPWREARLSVRPGITGLWQVCRHDRATGDFHQWIYYDILYVRHLSFLLDLKIMFATVASLGGKRQFSLARLLSADSLEEDGPA